VLNYEKQKTDFIRLIENGGLSHAYLFFGGNEPDREEKSKFAISLANFIEKKKFEISQVSLGELFILKKSEDGSIGIDKVRLLKNFLYQKPIFSEKRIVVICDSERMTPEAQNAVLKIVEEPPADSLILFILRNEESLLPTLVSRLQRVHFPALPAEIKQSAGWKSFSIDDVLENGKEDEFFELLLADLAKDLQKNWMKLKEVLKRLVLAKQFNTNKRLQLRALETLLSR
jgi:DNA polymerase III delta prime subunit